MKPIMEIPTTNDVNLVKEFQELFNTEIRPAAEHEFKIMNREFYKEFNSFRDKLIPVSLIMDTMIYMTRNLAMTATDEMREAYESGDVDKLNATCSNYDPYWRAARALSMAIRGFSQDPSKGADYIGEDYDEDHVCYVCGDVSPEPISWEVRKECHGGCPECAETIEAVFNK